MAVARARQSGPMSRPMSRPMSTPMSGASSQLLRRLLTQPSAPRERRAVAVAIAIDKRPCTKLGNQSHYGRPSPGCLEHLRDCFWLASRSSHLGHSWCIQSHISCGHRRCSNSLATSRRPVGLQALHRGSRMSILNRWQEADRKRVMNQRLAFREMKATPVTATYIWYPTYKAQLPLRPEAASLRLEPQMAYGLFVCATRAEDHPTDKATRVTR